MSRVRCNVCSQPPLFFEFEGDASSLCPSCGAQGPPLIVELVDVHLLGLVEKGPIRTGTGRRAIACQPKRDRLADPLPYGKPFSATEDPTAVTCPACRSTDAWKALAKLFGLDVPRSSTRIISDPNGGCCG